MNAYVPYKPWGCSSGTRDRWRLSSQLCGQSPWVNTVQSRIMTPGRRTMVVPRRRKVRALRSTVTKAAPRTQTRVTTHTHVWTVSLPVITSYIVPQKGNPARRVHRARLRIAGSRYTSPLQRGDHEVHFMVQVPDS